MVKLSPRQQAELQAHGHPDYWEIQTTIRGANITFKNGDVQGDVGVAIECAKCGKVLITLFDERDNATKVVENGHG